LLRVDKEVLVGRVFIIVTLVVFSVIGIAAWMKDSGETSLPTPASRVEVNLDLSDPEMFTAATEEPSPRKEKTAPQKTEGLPEADIVDRLFTTGKNQLPIVETVTYKSRVKWMKGRPAWLSDYAAHYNTSRHFVARSLHGKDGYEKHDVSNGDRFNVLHPDKDLEFWLVIDQSRCKLWLYAYDKGEGERALLKTYDVGLGRENSDKESGLLTPLGTYKLGNRIMTFAPKKMGNHKGKKVEMIRVFGTRWIPFEQEISDATEPAKGYGIHGSPWKEDPETKDLIEDAKSVGEYASDGCIRLRSEDIEEVYAIVVSKPAFVSIVRDFHEAELPGKEVVW